MKKLGFAGASLAIAVGIVGVFAPQSYAAAQTCNWVGTAGDNKFSTVSNWANCNSSIPQEGDVISFDATTPFFADYDTSGGTFNPTLTNDLGVSLGGVVLTGKDSWGGASGVIVSSLSLTNDGAITFAADTTKYKSFDLFIGMNSASADLTGNGAATIVVEQMANLPNFKYRGISGITTLTVDAKVSTTANQLFSLRQSAGNYFSPTKLVLKNADVYFFPSEDQAFATDFDITNGTVIFMSFSPGTNTLTFSGDVVLHGDMYAKVWDSYTLKFTGAISGGKILKDATTDGILIVGSETVVPPIKSTAYDGAKDTEEVRVGQNETAVMNKDAVRSSAYVSKGGILKGIGTFKFILGINPGGIIAPGMSPGCLTSDRLSLSGIYQFELGGTEACTGYDQLKVLNATDIDKALVISSDYAELQISLYDKFVPVAGQVYTIISQGGSKPVDGTFKDLPEGATFIRDGVTYRISYVGGDGNDVTLTVVSVPKAPNTGTELVTANPIAIAAGTLFVAGTLGVLGRKLQAVRK